MFLQSSDSFLFVFDLDGTLYDLQDVVSHNYEMEVCFVCEQFNMSEVEAMNYLEQNNIFPQIKENSMSATELFLSRGISPDIWNDYRRRSFMVEWIDRSKAVPSSLLSSFCELGRCILLSSNAHSSIMRILSYLNIDSCIFEEIICSDRYYQGGSFNKSSVFQFLTDKEKDSHAKVLSIGDRFHTDIEPALRVGGYGVLLVRPSSLATVLSDIKGNSLSDCDGYLYFKPVSKKES